MLISPYLRSFALRHAVGTGLSVLLAYWMDQHFSFSHEGFMVLAAFFSSQTTRGTPLRQGLVLLVVMMSAVCLASILRLALPLLQAMYFTLALLFIFSSVMGFILRPYVKILNYKIVFFSLLFLVLLHAFSASWLLLQNRMMEVLIGSLIGIIGGQIIFSFRLTEEFQEAMVPVLKALSTYSASLIKPLQENLPLDLRQERKEWQRVLQAQKNLYPEWVYEIGFSPGFRSGFRFFLVHLERVMEVLFSMEYLASQKIEIELLSSLSSLMTACMQKNQALMQILIAYFSHEVQKPPSDDFITDVLDLEKKLHTLLPQSLDLLDLSPDYILLTSFVRQIKDLRQLLLKLIMSLPENNLKALQAHPRA